MIGDHIVPDWAQNTPGRDPCPGQVHEWIDVTAVGDRERKFECAFCGMPGVRDPAVRVLPDDDLFERRGRRS